MGRLFCYVMVITVSALGSCAAREPAESQEAPPWRVGSYSGITPGASTVADVKRIFGEPIWSGPMEQEPDSENPPLHVLEYENVGEFGGRTSVLFVPETAVVEALSIYPEEVSFQKLRERYGNKFLARESALGPCPTEEQLRDFRSPKRREYPVFYVYPEFGRYVSVDAKGHVAEIGFLRTC